MQILHYPTVPSLQSTDYFLIQRNANNEYKASAAQIIAGLQPLIQVPSATLLGRTSSGFGPFQSITLAGDLAFSGSTLTTTLTYLHNLPANSIMGNFTGAVATNPATTGIGYGFILNNGQMTINPNLSLTTLAVSGATTFNGAVNFNSGMTFSGGASYTGTTTFSALNVTGAAAFTGSSSFVNLNASGNANITGTLSATGITTLGNNLNVTGTSALTGAVSLNSTLNVAGISTLTGNAVLNSNLSVVGTSNLTGAATLNSTLNVSGLTTLAQLHAANIDASPIGANTPSTGIFTNLSATGTTAFSGLNISGNSTLGVAQATSLNNTPIGSITPSTGKFTTLQATSLNNTGATTLGSTLAVTGATTLSSTLNVTGLTTLTSLNVANIDATPIGANTPATGSFTNLNSSGTASLTTLNISGNTQISGTLSVSALNNTTIGLITPASAGFTTLGATTLNVTGVSTLNSASVTGVLTFGSTTSSISTATVLANSSNAVARSIQSVVSDTFNVKNFGATMVSGDTTAWLNAYNALGTHGVLYVPNGNFASTTYPTLQSPYTKSIQIHRMGTFDSGANAPGTSSVPTLGDGDLNTGFIGGYYSFAKKITNSTNGYTTVQISLNNGSANGQFSTGFVLGNLTTIATSQPNALGYTWNNNAILYSGASNQNQDVNYASTIYQTGKTAAFSFYGLIKNTSGYASGTNGGGMVSGEFDIKSNGPDGPTNQILADPTQGGRAHFHLTFGNYNPPVWVANNTQSLGDCITASPANAYTYVCTTAGTTGSTQPTWPVIVNNTVTDGTVVWTCGTTIQAQLSRGIQISSVTSSSTMATALIVNANIDSSAIDLSQVVASSSLTAGVRLPANLPIDFSGNSTYAGLNLRTLQYTSASSALTYTANSNLIISAGDNGGVQIQKGLGFFGTTPPLVKPTFTGAKGSNAALASVIAALVASGFAIDSTTV